MFLVLVPLKTMSLTSPGLSHRGDNMRTRKTYLVIILSLNKGLCVLPSINLVGIFDPIPLQGSCSLTGHFSWVVQLSRRFSGTILFPSWAGCKDSLWVIRMLKEWPGVRREPWAKGQVTRVLGLAMPPASWPRKCPLRSEDIIVLAYELRFIRLRSSLKA